jgi:FixJ family two-component response regulator
MKSTDTNKPLVCVIDDDAEVRGSLDALLRSADFRVATFASPDGFMASDEADAAACLILDVRLKDADGLDFQQTLLEADARVPVILITGHGDIPMTVRGMKAGAVDFLAKPFVDDALLTAVTEAVKRDQERRAKEGADDSLKTLYSSLTPRERDVMGLVTAGLMNKQIAAKLALSEVTVKIHRGNLMRKMQAPSLADLVRMAETLGVRDSAAARYGHA